MKAFTLLVPLLSAVYVSAHGILTNFGVNGANQNRNVIRPVRDQNPNIGAENGALTCGPNARPAAGIANVNPGDTLTFDWRTASGSPWPHNTGPMLTYMASCGSVTCDQFDASGARWFKVSQVGRKQNSGEWFQQDLMSGAPASMRLPENVAPGNYLIRHEIIALHLATSNRGAEFYPGCVQVRVGGSGTGRPAEGDLVSFPGGYRDSDPGILAPSVFNSAVPYVFPGPRVAELAGGGAPAPSPSATPSPSGGNNNNNNGGASSTSATPPATSPAPGNNNNNGGYNNNTPTTTAPPAPGQTGKSGSCKLKKRAAAANASEVDNVAAFKPRHISRVMRRMALDLSH